VGDLMIEGFDGDPSQDPRWIGLRDGHAVCTSCGQVHQGNFNLAVASPYYWQGDPEPCEPQLVRDWSNVLTSDLCVIAGEHFFVRCLLNIPLKGIPGQSLGFGVWSTVSKENFKLYFSSFGKGEQGSLGPWFGWFSNQINGYPDTLELKCNVYPQNDNARPLLTLESTLHPLATDQRDGLTIDRLFEIYSANGHDLT
jgi:hypothetical protein